VDIEINPSLGFKAMKEFTNMVNDGYTMIVTNHKDGEICIRYKTFAYTDSLCTTKLAYIMTIKSKSDHEVITIVSNKQLIIDINYYSQGLPN